MLLCLQVAIDWLFAETNKEAREVNWDIMTMLFVVVVVVVVVV